VLSSAAQSNSTLSFVAEQAAPTIGGRREKVGPLDLLTTALFVDLV